MPTKYDVFAKLIELAPCTAKDLLFKVPVYSHLNGLVRLRWIKKTKQGFVPIKNDETQSAFKIIKYCIKNGLDFNIFFSKNVGIIVKTLFETAPSLRPKILKGNKDSVGFLNYLERNQFILVAKKKPRRGLVLEHQIFNNVLILHKIKEKFKTSKYLNLYKEVIKLKGNPINPFDDNVFSFLSGSAQLEGGTITAGETRELLINDIYPDKSQKDIQMVKNLNEAMHYILDNLNQEITSSHIKKLNELVLFSLHRNGGKYKKTHNKIQGNSRFKTAKPSEVFSFMEKYCVELQNISDKDTCLKKLGYIHNQIQHIHPFSDGNSRTTRMILNWMLLKHNLPLLVIKMGCFDEYMILTKLSNERDDEKLKNLFYHILIHESLMS